MELSTAFAIRHLANILPSRQRTISTFIIQQPDSVTKRSRDTQVAPSHSRGRSRGTLSQVVVDAILPLGFGMHGTGTRSTPSVGTLTRSVLLLSMSPAPSSLPHLVTAVSASGHPPINPKYSRSPPAHFVSRSSAEAMIGKYHSGYYLRRDWCWYVPVNFSWFRLLISQISDEDSSESWSKGMFSLLTLKTQFEHTTDRHPRHVGGGALCVHYWGLVYGCGDIHTGNNGKSQQLPLLWEPFDCFCTSK